MHPRLIQNIVEEIRAQSSGNFLGKIFQLTPLSFALDIGLRSGFLFICAEPSSPRLYLIQRKVKELEKASVPLQHFGQLMKSQLGGGRITNLEKDGNERVVRITFRIDDELGSIYFRRLVVQLTGRAANVFILDELNRVETALRPPRGIGQQTGNYYLPPPTNDSAVLEEFLPSGSSPSLAADEYFQQLEKQRTFDSRLAEIRNQLRQAKNQKTKLKKNLEKDLEAHGDPESHKRLGDLLLANLATAKRDRNKTEIIDFYSDHAPSIEVEIDESMSLQDAAAQRFRQYTKAKRAQEGISERLESLNAELQILNQREVELSEIGERRDEDRLAALLNNAQKKPASPAKQKAEPQIPGVRRYLSSDGYEILVGRAAKDNDNLTFRVARSNDLWLHAGDYPGSHVVVRNPNRKEIPQRTVIEAAQLAGKFSQASADAKVVIHYTERKFLSKPKGAAPGLVRLSSFRSITVEPKESVERL